MLSHPVTLGQALGKKGKVFKILKFRSMYGDGDRKWSLDELPQLINVLKSYLPKEKRKLEDIFRIISTVTPGLTGLWQVRGRNILAFKDRILLNDYYIRNWSLWPDIIILVKTIKVWLKREEAY
jgi:undecaprenyl-phosphate galactose phosphotransferase